MKILNLRKNIIANLSVAGVLLIILGALIYYNNAKNQSIIEEVSKIQSDISHIHSEYIELQEKVTEALKYQQAWKLISNNRKSVVGLRMDNINNRIESISEKYSIIKPAIKVIVPETLSSGIFKRSTVFVTVSQTSISFEALNDIKAISFLSEFINSSPGYPILINLEIKKLKQYSDQDLVQISTGRGEGAVSVKADFYWYLYKPLNEKENTQQSPKNKSTQNSDQ